MKYFIDEVINLMYSYTTDSEDSEMKEQAAGAAPAAGASGGGGGSVPTVPNWADTVGGPQRGPANMLGKDGEVWSSDVKRGVANQIW